MRCRTAGLEIRDGGTEQSPLLGRFCGLMPHTQKSTGNTMYVRYYTNSNNPKLGFYAKASIGIQKYIKVAHQVGLIILDLIYIFIILFSFVI